MRSLMKKIQEDKILAFLKINKKFGITFLPTSCSSHFIPIFSISIEYLPDGKDIGR